MRQIDIAIIGGGLAGSTAAAMLGRAGFSAVLIDPHEVYPPDFRCEKLDGLQVQLLRKTGLDAAVFAAAGLALARRRIEPRWVTLGIFGLTAACLVLGVHWVDFQSVHGKDTRVIQGRYLLPLMPLAGVAVAAALSNLARPRRQIGAALVLGGMAALQLLSLGLVAGRYFA